jgi:shikimate kinase
VNNIALIGFMGAGKTTVGRALAARLGWQLIETDALVCRKAGKPVARIFQEDGETVFRRLEKLAVAEAVRAEKAVIACGGGVVMRPTNIGLLKKRCFVVYLTASREVILSRVSGDQARPLLDVADPGEAVAGLLEVRRPLYARAADFRVSTSRSSVDAVVERIIKKMKA